MAASIELCRLLAAAKPGFDKIQNRAVARPIRPLPGLSIPLITVLDAKARVLEDEQREVVRFAIQRGAGADIIFAAGTTGEWDRIDNPRRQMVSRIAVEECRSASRDDRKVEAWVGVTAPNRRETLENLAYAIELAADAAVVAPLSIADAADPVDFIAREIADVFDRLGARFRSSSTTTPKSPRPAMRRIFAPATSSG